MIPGPTPPASDQLCRRCTPEIRRCRKRRPLVCRAGAPLATTPERRARAERAVASAASELESAAWQPNKRILSQMNKWRYLKTQDMVSLCRTKPAEDVAQENEYGYVVVYLALPLTPFPAAI